MGTGIGVGVGGGSGVGVGSGVTGANVAVGVGSVVGVAIEVGVGEGVGSLGLFSEQAANKRPNRINNAVAKIVFFLICSILSFSLMKDIIETTST